jgi:hypothetical protein
LEEIPEDEDDEDDGEEDQPPVMTSTDASSWLGSQYLQQKDDEQVSKITGRENKVQVFDNGHLPMNREQLGVSNNFQVKVGQDTLNPTLQTLNL